MGDARLDSRHIVELVIRQPGHADRVVRLPQGITRLGRAEDTDVVLPDVGVSRRHAQLVVAGDGVRVEDLGSGNGSYVRGERIDQMALRDGDEVVIDPFVLQVRLVANRARGAAPKARARLDVIAGPGLAHTTYPIPTRGLTMGRSDSRDIVIPDPASSRHHCSIFLQQGRHALRDMGSANGVFVNGERAHDHLLTSGDVITIGNTELRYVFDDSTRQGAAIVGPPVVSPRSAAATLVSKPARPTRRSEIGMALSVLASLVFAGAIVVIGFLVVVFVQGDTPPQTLTTPSGPPVWRLAIADPPSDLDPASLSRSGVALVMANDHGAALEKFWLLLMERPNAEAAERFAYASGEHLVLETMRQELFDAAAEREARDLRRDDLLVRAQRRDRAARRELEADYRDDPLVMEALRLPYSDVANERARRLTDAAELASRSQWREAADAYAEVLAVSSGDPALVRTARTGLTLAQKELAQAVHEDWVAGVLAEAAGDAVVARASFSRVLERDPGNRSARYRLDHLSP